MYIRPLRGGGHTTAVNLCLRLTDHPNLRCLEMPHVYEPWTLQLLPAG